MYKMGPKELKLYLALEFMSATIAGCGGGGSSSKPNNAPIIEKMDFPDSAKPFDTISGTVSAKDADSDALIYNFIWKVNGNAKKNDTSSNNMSNFSYSMNDGDKVQVDVLVTDGKDSVTSSKDIAIQGATFNIEYTWVAKDGTVETGTADKKLLEELLPGYVFKTGQQEVFNTESNPTLAETFNSKIATLDQATLSSLGNIKNHVKDTNSDGKYLDESDYIDILQINLTQQKASLDTELLIVPKLSSYKYYQKKTA